MRIVNICNRIIEYSFHLLLFFVPLFITPVNYELFEYNKMMITYALTIIIIGSWLVKMTASRRFHIQRTPLDIPIILFLFSQIISTYNSIDPHVSIWGYYSRFHGGLLSTLAYLTLYYALVSNLDKRKVFTALCFGVSGGALVAIYAVAEHFGIDSNYWVQDVKNRVFSTLGQPNWLAAYLSILIPIVIAFGLHNLLSPEESQKNNSGFGNKNYRNGGFPFSALLIIPASLFFFALLYTKSRSGFTGFWAGNIIFWIILLVLLRKKVIKWLLILNLFFLTLTFFVGSPFEQVNKYFSYAKIQEQFTHVKAAPSPPPPPGGTESGEIRKIVWKGAIDVWHHYPIFGSGVETFAFSYYQYRPAEHNMVSEWDFLYNKAHNEYLNFLATTGIFGLGSYLLLIVFYLIWTFRYLLSNITDSKIRNDKQSIINSQYYLILALFAGYVSILVSNFFGFSVVIVAIFFFLIPAFSFILTDTFEPQNSLSGNFKNKVNGIYRHLSNQTAKPLASGQWIAIIIILISTSYGLVFFSRLWLADVSFAKGYNFNRIESYNQAYEPLKQAVEINPDEPLYRDELSVVAANLAIQAAQEKDATQAAAFAREAIVENKKALEVSPVNVSFWKTRTRIFYTLSALNDGYNEDALEAVKKANELAPTDAKIAYNLAVLYGRVGKQDKAMKTLEETIRLKPDYRDARYALALYLKATGKQEEAQEQLKYILEKISPDDEQVKELMGQQKTKR